MAATAAPDIQIKGIREGILLVLNEVLQTAPFTTMIGQLREELADKEAFLQGSHVVADVGHAALTRAELTALRSLLEASGLELWTVLSGAEGTREAARGLGLATRLPGSNTDLDGNRLQSGSDAGPTSPAPGEPVAGALVLRETIRSGRSIYHKEDVVIIGDVNPGAEVIAGGDVVVWGRLRGLVHAGAHGRVEALICALELSPTQLRIANRIAIPPEGRAEQPVPEMALIREDKIVAEPWSG